MSDTTIDAIIKSMMEPNTSRQNGIKCRSTIITDKEVGRLQMKEETEIFFPWVNEYYSPSPE